jgi:protein TonB
VDALASFWAVVLLHLGQTTVVLLPLLLLGGLLRSAPARTRRRLWTLGLGKLLVPAAGVGGALAIAASRFADGGALAGAVRHWLALATIRVPVDAETLAISGAPDLSRPALLVGVTVAWGIGTMTILGRTLLDHLRVGRVDEVPPAELSSSERRALGAALARAGVDGRDVRIARAPLSPFVAGFRSPGIVIPRALLGRLPLAELGAVLGHEEVHRRRRDPLVFLGYRVAAALFFFYPPAWVLLRRLRQVTEDLCDEEVVRSGVSGPLYARAIARTLRLGLEPVTTAPAAVRGNTALIRRLTRLDRLERRVPMARHHLVLALAALLVVAGTIVGPIPVPSSAGPDEDVTHPVPVERVFPEYPEAARKAGIEGRSVVRIVVGTDGTVTEGDIRESAGNEDLDDASLEAALQWKFRPAERDGEPVEMEISIPFEFRLN